MSLDLAPISTTIQRSEAPRRRVCPVDVYARIRATLPNEDTCADPLQTFTSAAEEITALLAAVSPTAMLNRVSLSVSAGVNTKAKVYRGLAGVFDPLTCTAEVYKDAVAPLVRSVVRGETACVFAYGHTGSGKTHTVIGYDNAELGLYRRAVLELTDAIMYTPQLQLQVRCAELYQGKVYDLLADRAECQLREDADGQVHIRSATVVDEQGRVRVHSLHAAYARHADDVVSLVQHALASRAVGNSPVHAQSSRSHALIELQLVTPEVRAAREALLEAEAELVPAGKARDSKFISISSRMYVPDPDSARKGAFKSDRSRVPDDEHSEFEHLQQQTALLENKVQQAREREQNAVTEAAAFMAGLTTNLLEDSDDTVRRNRECGTLVLVDLAGAEYATLDARPPAAALDNSKGVSASTSVGHRSAVELSEGREINRSLLSLKECLRALARDSTHVPYRNAKLTHLLRRYLQADLARAIMIATVAPTISQAPPTANTLQYAALVADLSR